MALTGPSLCVTHERSSGPSLTGGSVVRSARSVHMAASDAHPAPIHFPTTKPVIGQDSPTTVRRPPGRGGPPQFPPPPSERSAPSTPGSLLRPRFQGLRRFQGLHREQPGSALPQCLTTRQASLHATDRSVASPKGLSTLGSGPARFQTEPPACYRLPGAYRDRTYTGRRRRASDQVMTDGRSPP